MKPLPISQCKKFQHREFILYADDYIIEPWLDWMVEYLEEAVSSEQFQPGETMQIGWMINRIEEEDGELTLCEPDFSSAKVNWEKKITKTVRDLFIQRYVADSVGMTEHLNFPLLGDTAIRCNRFGDGAFWMERTEPSENNPNDSGWFFGCIDEDHNHDTEETLSLISLYEAATINNFVVPYLSLPIGSYIFESGIADAFDIGFEREQLAIQPDSYLEHMLNQRRE